MSLVISVQRSLPWAHAWDEDRGSSRSDASSNASIVAIVCSSNSRTASRTVAAIGTSRRPSVDTVARSRYSARGTTITIQTDVGAGEGRSLLEGEPDPRGGQLELDAAVRRGHFHHHAVLVLHDHRLAAAEQRPSRASSDIRAGEVLELLEGDHGPLRGAPREARFADRKSHDLDGVFTPQVRQCPRAPAESDPGRHGTL